MVKYENISELILGALENNYNYGKTQWILCNYFVINLAGNCQLKDNKTGASFKLRIWVEINHAEVYFCKKNRFNK